MLVRRGLCSLSLGKLLRLVSRRLSRCGGDDHASRESIDICRDRSGTDVAGMDADGDPSCVMVEVRRLSFSAVSRGFSCPEVKSSLISSKANDIRWKARLRRFSMIDGSRCSKPYTFSGVESGESLSGDE